MVCVREGWGTIKKVSGDILRYRGIGASTCGREGFMNRETNFRIVYNPSHIHLGFGDHDIPAPLSKRSL
jgi:hypothetical protein